MTVVMPVPASQPTDLSERRRRLGASRETMAAGIGVTVDDIRAIENGSAPPALSAEYATWLDRLERCPAEQRREQLLIAGRGQRFTA